MSMPCEIINENILKTITLNQYQTLHTLKYTRFINRYRLLKIMTVKNAAGPDAIVGDRKSISVES